MSFASDIGRMVAHGPMRPTTETETRNLLTLLSVAMEPEEEQIRFYKECLGGMMALKILDARFRACIGETVKFSPTLLIWLATMADRPGNVVLLVAVLAHALREGRELSINSLVESYFVDGIPTQDNYRAAWDAQKRSEHNEKFFQEAGSTGDNMLDLDSSWK